MNQVKSIGKLINLNPVFKSINKYYCIAETANEKQGMELVGIFLKLLVYLF